MKDTPHSELLLRTELNQKTSNSGHNNLFHMIESTNMVIPVMYIGLGYLNIRIKFYRNHC